MATTRGIEAPVAIMLALSLLTTTALFIFTAIVRLPFLFSACAFTGKFYGRGLLLCICGCIAFFPTGTQWTLAIGATAFFFGVSYIIGDVFCQLRGPPGSHVARPFLGMCADPELKEATSTAAASAAGAAKRSARGAAAEQLGQPSAEPHPNPFLT